MADGGVGGGAFYLAVVVVSMRARNVVAVVARAAALVLSVAPIVFPQRRCNKPALPSGALLRSAGLRPRVGECLAAVAVLVGTLRSWTQSSATPSFDMSSQRTQAPTPASTATPTVSAAVVAPAAITRASFVTHIGYGL